jgi:hypothetical protein
MRWLSATVRERRPFRLIWPSVLEDFVHLSRLSTCEGPTDQISRSNFQFPPIGRSTLNSIILVSFNLIQLIFIWLDSP